MGLAAFYTYRCRKRMIKSGEYFDVEYEQKDFDKVFPLPKLSADDSEKNYIEWPLPQMTDEMKKNMRKKLKIIDIG
jgi:hypothetical protein